MSGETEYTLRRQTEAAKSLLANLRADGVADDAELVADSIEGQTGLTEAISAALAEIDECDVLSVGAAAKAEQFTARAAAAQKRGERIKAAIEQAMIATDQNTIRLPGATLSLSKRAPGVVVANEAEIPSRFWTTPEQPAPKLDKKALLAALNAKEVIPGAGLDNGSVSLTVRRK